MNQIVCCALVVLAIFVQGYECIKTEEQQVKMITSKTWYYNPKYVNDLVYTVTKGNATYNNMQLHWDVAQDLPEDLRLESIVYITDSNFENPKVLLKDETPVCEKSENYELLPLVLIEGPKELVRKCIKKGVYDKKNMGQFRFEILVPNLDSKGTYYKVDYRLGSPDETVLIATFYSEWGFLNN